MKVIKNIRKNSQSLAIIAMALIIFSAFVFKGVKFQDNEYEAIKLRIGLYKQGDTLAKDYFNELIKALHTLGEKNPKIKFDIILISDGELEDFLRGESVEHKVDIIGELSPREYVKYHNQYECRPFLGIEYNNKSYYQSVFFAPHKVNRAGAYLDNSVGWDNIEKIREAISSGTIAIQPNSTSGYIYPKAYLIKQKINHNRTEDFDDPELMYKEVLRKGDNNFLGGFMADWRFEKYDSIYRTNDHFERPFIVDKSEPIPNGVFVLTKNAIKNDSVKEKLIRLWKTLNNIPISSMTKITGWRTGVESDLSRVSDQQKVIDYESIRRKYNRVWIAITIGVMIIMVSILAFIFLRK